MKFLVFSVLCMHLLLSGCMPQKKASPILKELSGSVFGSTYSIKYLGDLDPEVWKKELEIFFKEFNDEFSTYQKTSTISALNEAPSSKKIKVSAKFIQMLELSKTLYEDTKGAFDPTLEPILKVWGFSGEGKPKRPSDVEISTARAKVGFHFIKWDSDSQMVWKTKNGVSLNLNAFAPGWAADLLGSEMEKKGINNFMIDIGGEILTKGNKGENLPWVIGIEEPSDQLGHQIRTAVKMSAGSIATSGNYRQYFNDKGEKKSHIIDPRTGMPVAHQISSATIISQTAAEADAWGTAMMVLGDEGLKIAEQKGIHVLMLKAESPNKFTSLFSSTMKEYLLKNQI